MLRRLHVLWLVGLVAQRVFTQNAERRTENWGSMCRRLYLVWLVVRLYVLGCRSRWFYRRVAILKARGERLQHERLKLEARLARTLAGARQTGV
jgi:hypothetical protein